MVLAAEAAWWRELDDFVLDGIIGGDKEDRVHREGRKDSIRKDSYICWDFRHLRLSNAFACLVNYTKEMSPFHKSARDCKLNSNNASNLRWLHFHTALLTS